ncbi:MAG: NAD(P)-dependent oxidoreductase [Propioniciclava sp.]
MKISVLGLGRMGTAFAERLLAAGHEVTVWNRTPGRARALLADGAREAASLAAAAEAEVVHSMVLDDQALAALYGDQGLFAGAHTPRVWIDSSTVSPGAAQAAAAVAAAAGTSFVSAPVSGNPGVVRAGQAIFAVSGDDDRSLETATAVLQDIGRATYLVGEGVSAATVKLCTNALLGITMQALAEVAVLGERAGVSRAGLMAFLNDSVMASAFTRYKTAAIVDLDLAPTFTPAGMRKDLRLAVDAGREFDVPAPLISAVEVELSRLAASGLADDQDFAALILQVARDAGVSLAPETGGA